MNAFESTRSSRKLLIVTVLVVASGCAEEPVVEQYNPNVSARPYRTPGEETTYTPQPPAQTTTGPAATPAQQPVIAAAPPANPFPVRLSAGTSLPQTGVDGTVMGFSVDYQVSGDGLNPSARHVLVVEGRGGKSVQQPFQLMTSGTVQFVTSNLHPEDEPFQGRIEELASEGSSRRVSLSVPLQ